MLFLIGLVNCEQNRHNGGMNILLVTESYWPNADGGALFERRLALGLADKGHNVSVWAPAKNFSNYLEEDGKTTIYRERAVTLLFNRKYKVSFWPAMHTKKIFKTTKPDVIHIHNPSLLGLTAQRYARKHGIPIVATNHLMPENILLNLKGTKVLYNTLYKLVWRYLVWFHNRCDYVTSPTPTATDFLKEFGVTKPLQPVSNGIDLKVFKPGLDASKLKAKYKLPDLPILLYLGRVDGEKRLDIILRAMPEVLKNTKCHLLIVGFGKEMDNLKHLASTLHVDKNVTFTGYIDEADKPLFYNLCDMFVISSPAELQSIVTLEAMATAKPVVSVDVAALKELVHDGENGYLFTENRFQELATRTIDLLRDDVKRTSFGKESLKIVTEHHSTDVMFDAYESIYRQVQQ